MSLSRIRIILVWNVLVQGILLPGPCPQTPPMHEIGSDYRPRVKVLRGVAFSSGRQSYIFLDIGPQHANGLNAEFKFDHEKEKIIFSLINITRDPYYSSDNVLEKSNATDTAVFRSTISYLSATGTMIQSECHKPINDTVKMWIEEHAIIIWSCLVHTTQYHDEAVLVMSHFKSTDRYNSKNISEIKSVVVKYLSPSLIDNIDWKVANAERPNIVSTYFPCSARDNAIPFIILFLIIWAMGLAVVWLTSREKCCPKTKNQVGPHPFTN